MTTIWQAIEPQLISAIILIIVTATGLVVAWLKAQARKWEPLVKDAVLEVEVSASGSHFMTGPQKKREALNILRSTAPGLPEAKAAKLIEKAVHESGRPPPLPRGRL